MLSKTSQYAIRAVIELSMAAKSNGRLGVADLAKRLGAPQHFLAKVLQQLARSGMISSAKGPGGGFYLSASNMDNSLADIVKLFDGEGFFRDCILGMPECSAQHPCPLHVQFAAYREGLTFHLKNHTIEAMSNYLESKESFRFRE